MKALSTFISICIVLYMTMIVSLFFQQRSLQYAPDVSDPSPSQTVTPEMHEEQVLTTDGRHNEMWYFLPRDSYAKVIVIFHGNAGNQGTRGKKVRFLLDSGVGVVVAGYRGYGGNVGTPTEDGLFIDARAVIDHLIKDKNIPQNRLVLYGESLGSGVAVQMASEYPEISGLVLDVPFDSALDVARDRYWYILGLSKLMKDPYRSDVLVPHLMMPKLVIAAGRDDVIPVRHAKRLFDLAADPKRLEILSDAHHNDTYQYGAGALVLSFVKNLP